MKKVVCILMAIILIASLTMSANAELVPLPVTDQEFLYEFAEYCSGYNANIIKYDELYYHYDDNDEIDWALVYGYTNAEAPMLLYRIVGNRLISAPTCSVPFDARMGVYDVADGKFYDVTDDLLTRYDGLADVYLEMGAGRLIGDIDGDDELTIIDATVIQRCEASIMDYPADDEVKYTYSDEPRYYSDFNRDGERDILDATCIQRYLADMPYAIG